MLVPLISKLAVAKKALSVTLRDITGAYNVSTNPGGYGTPNIASPPGTVGFTFRQWDATTPYINYVTSDSASIVELLSSDGHELLASIIGLTKFQEGVNHIKYYPFDPVVASSEFSVVNGSKTITLVTPTLGMFDPTALDAAYIAVILIDDGGALASGILLLGNRDDWTSTTFTVDTAWGGNTGDGYTIKLATEADLKILIKESTEACIAGKIGKIAEMECCENKVVEKLTDLTMWMFAATVKLQCEDYSGANDLVLKAYNECTYCISPDCLTCN